MKERVRHGLMTHPLFLIYSIFPSNQDSDSNLDLY